MPQAAYQNLFDFQVNATATEPDELPEFEQPGRPDPGLIELIHDRGFAHDGYVPITRKRTAAEIEDFQRAGRKGNPEWEQIASLPARRLPCFYQMAADLDADSYQSICGMRRGQYWANPRGYVDVDGTPLRAAYRKKHNVSILTACWTDLDFYNLGFTIGQVIGSVIDAANAKSIPRPSVLIDSGKGCWVLWLLRGEHPALWQKNTPDVLPLWEALQGKIKHVFTALGADVQAKDASRVCRIAGSLNTSADRRVSYFPWYDETGILATYEIKKLAPLFGLDPVAIPPNVKELPPPLVRINRAAAPGAPRKSAAPVVDATPRNPVKSEAGKKGARARWKNDRERFYKLLRIRHEIKPGYRNAAVGVLALILKKLHRTFDEAVHEVTHELFPRLAQDGEQYHLTAAVATVRSTYDTQRNGNISHVQISAKLGVTAEEAHAIGGWSPAPPEQSETRPEKLAARLDRLRAIIDANVGQVPAAADLVLALRAAGFPASRASIYRDLDRLGLTAPGRRSKQPANLFQE